MSSRKELGQSSAITARQAAAHRVSKKLNNFLFSTLIISAYLLFTYYTFFNFALNILKNPLEVYLTLGIGAAGGYNLMRYCTRSQKKKPLLAPPKEPLPPPPDLNELKHAKGKVLKKEISLPAFAMIKRKNYGKKQPEKSSYFSKIKNWFSFSSQTKKSAPLKKPNPDSASEAQPIFTEKLNEKQPPPSDDKIKQQDRPSIVAHHVKKHRPKQNTSTEKIVTTITSSSWPSFSIVEEEPESEEENTIFEEIKELTAPMDYTKLPSTLFKATSANKNIYVKKDRLPASFIKFSEHINQLIHKNLTLTGGALTSLLSGSNQFNDLDCIVFEEQKNLLKLLQEAKQDALQYSCREVSKKKPIIKVILAEEHVSTCELLHLPDSTQTSFLDFPFQSSAAYIRTRNSLFYVNKVENTCIEIKCHKSVSATSFCNSSMLKLFDKEMKLKNNYQSKILSLYELHQIKSITDHEHAKLIEVDIKCCKTNESILENAIKDNMKTRDFKLSALYSNVLPDYDTLVIKGFDGAISSVNQKTISAVDPDTLFQKSDDLLCLFRLANIMLKYPDFECDDILQDILAQPIFENLFNRFIYSPEKNSDNITHLSQINTKLNKLFTRFDAESVIKILCKLNIIQAMTGIQDTQSILDTAPAFAEYINTVPNHYKKTAFYYFINIHFSLSENNQRQTSLMEKVKQTLEPEFEAPEFEKHIDSINQSKSYFLPDPVFSKMFSDIKLTLSLRKKARGLGLM